MHILDAELCVCSAAIVVLYDGIAYIDRITHLDVIEEPCHIEADRRYVMVRM